MTRTLCLIAALVFAAVLFPGNAAAANSVTSPDTGGGADVGLRSSLALDAAGNPVVSYYDVTNGDLKVLHCNDPDCVGGGESVTIPGSVPDPGSVGNKGDFSSLALDGSGRPVVSYYDATADALKVMRCNDANCAGGDEFIQTFGEGYGFGWYTSLALDASYYPVVSFYDHINADLAIIHCTSVNCTNGGSLNWPDTVGDVGRFTSLELDGPGYPVVSYYDGTSGKLKVLHCDDANCDPGGDTTKWPDWGPGVFGQHTSLALDMAGNPVVSYFDSSYGNLKMVHCNDAACAGVDDMVTVPDWQGIVGETTSLALDASGYPVVSYTDQTNSSLKVMHCNDVYCAGGNEYIASPDTAGIVGADTSLVLDALGRPVVSYYDADNGNLKLLHCGDATCGATSVAVGGMAELPPGVPMSAGKSDTQAGETGGHVPANALLAASLLATALAAAAGARHIASRRAARRVH